jgi:hypothetical protein
MKATANSKQQTANSKQQTAVLGLRAYGKIQKHFFLVQHLFRFYYRSVFGLPATARPVFLSVFGYLQFVRLGP